MCTVLVRIYQNFKLLFIWISLCDLHKEQKLLNLHQEGKTDVSDSHLQIKLTRTH